MIEIEYNCVSGGTLVLNSGSQHGLPSGQHKINIVETLLLGENNIVIAADNINILSIKIMDQRLDRKKSFKSTNTIIFVFDVLEKHANFSKHTGTFGSAMLRKDRVLV